jgi:hypothetical protein
MRTVWIYENGDTLNVFDSEQERAHGWRRTIRLAKLLSRLGPLHPAGSADTFGAPRATGHHQGCGW